MDSISTEQVLNDDDKQRHDTGVDEKRLFFFTLELLCNTRSAHFLNNLLSFMCIENIDH